MITAVELEIMRTDLIARQHEFLQQNGWVQNADNPAGVFLYKKQIGEFVYLAPQQTALIIQEFTQS